MITEKEYKDMQSHISKRRKVMVNTMKQVANSMGHDSGNLTTSRYGYNYCLGSDGKWYIVETD